MTRLLRITLLAAVAAALPLSAVAQSKYAIGVFVSRNQALPSAPVLGGAGLSSFSGPLGLRLNGAMNLKTDDRSVRRWERGGITAWSADADVVLAPTRGGSWISPLLMGFEPFGFLGIGMHGVRRPDGSDPALKTWSYGGGVSRPLFLGLSLEGDARYRIPLDNREPIPGGFSKDWEYRIGLAVNFGGGRRSARETRRPSGPPPMSTRSRLPRRAEPATPVSATRLMTTADDYVGTRYRYGGSAPSNGFDCSGFVQYVFARQEMRLPRTSRQMVTAGKGIVPELDELRPGDLVLFAQDGTKIDHVAIYVGNDRIIHSTASGGGVRYDDFDSPRGRWFLERMVAARRVISDGRSLVDTFDDAGLPLESLDPPDRAPRPR